jgi:hypothetical protein
MQLEGMKLKVEAQPKELQQQLERVVLEGNDARDLLHKNIVECTTIFKEVNDWMGVITPLQPGTGILCTRIQTLNEEATKTHDPLEQQEKFDEMQQANNSLNALFEAQTSSKEGTKSLQAHRSNCIPVDASG